MPHVLEPYQRDRFGPAEPYEWSSEPWREYFLGLAARIDAALGPRTVLDLGCARGLLVQAFAQRGIDATGVDSAQTVLDSASADVRGRLSRGSVTDQLAGRWDLIICVDVLEHIEAEAADVAIARMCAATDRVLFSSSPESRSEPSHVNVREPGGWAAIFADHGFFRRTDIELSSVSPWATLYERAELTPGELVYRYESYADPRRLVSRGSTHSGQPTDEAVARLTAQNQELAHRIMTLRDHAIGCEAQVAQARNETERIRHELAVLQAEWDNTVNAIRASSSWRIGQTIVAPADKLRAVRRRLKP